MPSFPTERARLKVRNPAGDVHVETRDVAETTVELVPLNESEATRQAIEKANVGARGDEVFVELEGRSWSISIGNWGVGSAKVSVRIICPERSDLECDTASADVRVIGTLGDARLRTASGDFEVDRVEGALEAKTASGDVKVDHVEGRAFPGVQRRPPPAKGGTRGRSPPCVGHAREKRSIADSPSCTSGDARVPTRAPLRGNQRSEG